MLGRKSEMRDTRRVVAPPAAADADAAADDAADADAAADCAVDAAADCATEAAADGAAADAAGLADGDAGVPAQAAPINATTANRAGTRAFIGLLLSQLPARATRRILQPDCDCVNLLQY
jgi:hypothetical protein